MAKTESEIKKYIKDYIDKIGGLYRTWYVGITNDPQRRLFDEHGVDREKWWVYATATSNAVARRVESYFINLGTGGAPGGGEEDARVVYAYKKTSSTNP